MKRLLPWIGLLALFALVASYIASREPPPVVPSQTNEPGAVITQSPDIAEPDHESPGLPGSKTEPERAGPKPAAALAAPTAEDDDIQPPAILGRVIPPTGFEDARYDVRLMIERDGEWEKVSSGTTVLASYSSAGGRFLFDRLSPGLYRVEAYMVVLRPVLADSTLVRLNAGVSQVEMRLPAPTARDFIIARVRGPEGPITSGVQLSLRAAVLNRLGSAIYGSAFHRGGGEYWLARDESKFRHESEGWWELTVRAEGFAPRTVRYARDAYHVIEVVLDPPAYLIVEVRGIEEHPQRDSLRVTCAEVGPYLESRLAGPTRLEPPDTENRFGPLEPGEYVVALMVGNREGFVDRRAVRLLAGENRVVLTAPELYSLNVFVPEELREKGVTVRRVDNFHFAVSGWSNQEGISEVSGLYAGEYVIWHADVGEMRISLPAMHGQQVYFQPLPFNSLWVSFRYAQHEVETDLMHGDIVVEVDGQSLAEAEHPNDVAHTSFRLEETKWVVIRDGARHTLSLKGGDLRNARLTFIRTRVD